MTLRFLTIIFSVMLHSLTGQRSLTPVLQNRLPLAARPYLDLPLGAIEPQGWLKEQLVRMKNGLSGHLDEIYPEVMGVRNGWLGGDGDAWERGPYWIDGLLPLAYILKDKELISKVQPWVEWTLQNQTEEGYIGPRPTPVPPSAEPGLQRGNQSDWWPKMVMLKILQQYYQATGDERVISCLTRYFRYQLKELPSRPLDYLTLWANRRGGDNLMVVYWLYNITGDEFLLELGDLLVEQTWPWTKIFLNESNEITPTQPWHYSSLQRYPFDPQQVEALTVSKTGSMHTVNLAQGLKQPVIYGQKDIHPKYLAAVKKALVDIKKYHGQPQGMYGGDEPLHGTNPVQGVEYCSVAEMMFSLETMLGITGDLELADLLEKITYNALPAQADEYYRTRQYFQAANQIELSDRMDVSFENHTHQGTDFVFGVLTGYPCCTANMHQAWPKFIQNLFYATADGGVAALLYGPAKVHLSLPSGVPVEITETTGFPFRDKISFTINLPGSAAFPFHVRIPSWTANPVITINGQVWPVENKNQLAIINRQWTDRDVVELHFPMDVQVTTWHEFSKTIERGPLVYALKIKDRVVTKDRQDRFRAFQEVYAEEPWNYALVENDLNRITESIKIVEKPWSGGYPWTQEHTPLELFIRGVHLPEWAAPNGVPYFPAVWGMQARNHAQRDICLIPYGCTRLRIAEFPVVRVP